MKRLVIYFHYDPAGCIDTVCRIAVQAMQKYGKVIFVTNGALAPADRVWVRQSGAGCIERENTGFDVGAYREALLTIGREALAEYEEIIKDNDLQNGEVDIAIRIIREAYENHLRNGSFVEDVRGY